MARDPNTTGATEGGSRYQMLDVWRGLVCFVVVLEHAGVVLWGVPLAGASGWDHRVRETILTALHWNVGGLLFFVMSGYCIASSLDGTRRRGDSPARFLYRRLWRIYPTYWAALLTFVAFVVTTDALGVGRLMHSNGVSLELVSPTRLHAGQWLGNLSLTETWRYRVLGGSETEVFTRVAWSLCYQEQFYVVCVLALWLVPRRLEWALGLATLAFAGFRAAAADVGALHRIEGTFPVFWHLFATGLAAYWRLRMSAGSPAWARRGVEAGLGLCAAVALAQGSVPTALAYGFGLLLVALYRWDARIGTLSWLGPVRACGRRSYSIYLIHLPVTMAGNGLLVRLGVEGFWPRALVVMPLVTAAAVAAGWAFHHAIERHFLGGPPVLGSRTGPSTPRRPIPCPVPVKVTV